MHRHGAADAAVTAGDDGDLAVELAGAAITVADILGLGPHGMFIAGLIGLFLRGKMLLAHDIRSLNGGIWHSLP
ncbi:hypothetical protein C8E00_104305 [Chromohalobacter marismortui]|uniref:Uncharacterized protein n=1 Tax=Chromohalobacter marismortui TaxID=42055 RepID=A0A4R7NMR5_9GAMM|nr:hypothetical protein C8E00_104305 [Chromohalobacter marismortui]